MKAIGHISITVLTLYAFRVSDPLIITGAIIGSVILDTDHHKAPLGKIIRLHTFFKHRHEVHSLFFSFIFAFLSLLFMQGYNLPIGVFIGCLLHLITDRFTSNVPYMFWYPTKQMKKKKPHLKR